MRRAKARTMHSGSRISMNILKLFYLLPYDGNTDFIHSLQIEWSLQQTSIKKTYINREAVARSENTTKSIFCGGNFSSCGSPSCFLYRFVGKFSCSGVPGRLPGLTPPSTAAENDLPVFQQNFAGYLHKGNMGKD